jgi:hypothetical protein
LTEEPSRMISNPEADEDENIAVSKIEFLELI